MGIKIAIPPFLKPFTTNMAVVEVNGSSVGGCFQYLVKQFPVIENKLFDKNGKLFAEVHIFVNGADSYPLELAKPVKDGDELIIVYMIDGG